MNIINSELWPVTLFFFVVAYIMYRVAAYNVKQGTYETKYDKEGRPYQQINKNDIHKWYEHKSGQGAILMIVLGVVSIFVLPWIHFNWG